MGGAVPEIGDVRDIALVFVAVENVDEVVLHASSSSDFRL
jgi:hypothetical protein